MRPSILARMKPGKAIGAVKHFADTFNWLVEFCDNLEAGPGLVLDRTNSAFPRLRLAASFWRDDFWQIRHDQTNGWQVKIAANATSVSGIHVHNERVGQSEWYKIANSPGNSTDGVVNVNLHVKRRVKVGSGTVESCIFVSASAVGLSTPGAEPANYSAGDWRSITVAVCTTATAGSGHSYSYERLHRDKVIVDAAVAGAIELYWAVPDVGSSNWATFTPHVEAQASAPICGGAMADAALSASGTVSVKYKIDCSGQSYAPSIETSGTATASTVIVPVYTIVDGCITGDTRANLAAQVFYP